MRKKALDDAARDARESRLMRMDVWNRSENKQEQTK